MAQRPKQKVLAPAAASVNNICLTQTPGAAGALTLNGAAANAGGTKATLDMSRRIAFISGGNIAARVFTITGTADGERVISETVTGVNNNTVTTLKDYLTVTSITVDAACAAALTVGTNATAGAGLACASSPWIPITRDAWEVSFSAIVTGVINYTVEFNTDYMHVPGQSTDPYFNPFPHPSIFNKTANDFGSIDFPISAIRITINSYTTGATLTFNVRAAAS